MARGVKKTKQSIMNEEEKRQWADLYQYVKKEILMYDQNQSLPSNLVLRLKGLSKGKLMANNATNNNADYSYEIILYTFKICKSKIRSAVENKTFNGEMNKFNYIAKIIENNINDVYQRVTNAKKTQDKIQSISAENIYHDGAEYVPTAVKENKKLKDLW